jgi:hypothetical protein
MPSFIKIGSDIQKLFGEGYKETDRMEIAEAHFRKIG